MKKHGFWIVPILVAMLAPAAWSQGRGQGKQQSASSSHGSPSVVIVFTTQEREMISDWFWSNRNGLPPGLAKRESLPPGLQKQLQRKGTLPPGLQKKLTPLPYALDSRLGRLPSDYLRVVIGRDIVLLDRRSNTILDVIANVIRNADEDDDDDENEDRRYERRREDPAGRDVYASRTPAPAPAPAPTRAAATAPASTSKSSGQHLKVRTTQAMSTETTKAGDRFVATLEEPVYEGNKMVARKGAQAEMLVVDADKGGRVKGVASLTVKLVRLQMTSGRYAEINSEPLVVDAHATKGEDATKIALTTGIGAGIGALAGGGKGAAIGAATGAAA
ncbi:MAG: hypothetical protein ACRD88_20665, partial [Terriglobia bacterium]